MFINKKITAALAAMVMALTSFSAFTVVSAEGAPAVTAEIVEKANVLDGESDFGVKFTLSNLEKNCDTVTFLVAVPGNYVNIKNRNRLQAVKTDTVMGNALITDFDTQFEASQKTINLKENDGELYTFWVNMSAPATGVGFANDDFFEFDFYLTDGKTLADLPTGSFKVTDMVVRYKGDLNTQPATMTNNAEVKGGDAEITPVITPADGQSDEEAVKAFTGYVDAEKVGEYVGDTDTDIAVGFKATISAANSTSGNLIWKVTDGTDTKYRTMSFGDSLAGEGSVVVGLAVKGLENGSASVAFLK